MADSYKHLELFSCEPNKSFFTLAQKRLEGYKNCKIFNESSQEFIPRILKEKPLNEYLTFFFLDAHGKGFEWPLRQEIYQITHNLNKAIILIDDFKVPGNPQFQYDIYESQECSMNYIKNYLNPTRVYNIIYPRYKIKTSNYPHFIGYIIILMGLNIRELNIPTQLMENFIIIYDAINNLA
ncbi:MAG: hypothetical protein ACTSRP_25585 [Candidatus Helarchaeota archaeon]